MEDDTAYVTLTQALSVSGHPTKGALAKFIYRFNRTASPPDRVLRTHRTVEIQSLKRALRIHAERGRKPWATTKSPSPKRTKRPAATTPSP